MRGRVLLVAVALTTGAFIIGPPGPAVSHHDAPVQPGAMHVTGNGVSWCTFNAMFQDGNRTWFAGSAGHCTGPVGTRISIPEAGDVGTVVYRELTIHDRSDPEAVWRDFSLIEIDEDKQHLVDPSLRMWGGPTGVQRDFTPGQATFQYGNGQHISSTEAPRARAGVLQEVVEDGSTMNDHHLDGWFLVQTGALGGDSGSLVVTGDGKALGVVSLPSFLLGEPGIVAGPTFDLILEDLNVAGFGLEVATSTWKMHPVADPEASLEGTQDAVLHCAQDPVSLSMWDDACVRNPNAWPFAPYLDLLTSTGGPAEPARPDRVVARPYTWGQGNAGVTLGTDQGLVSVASNSVSVQTTMPVREMNDLAAVTVTAQDGISDRVFLTVCVHSGEDPHVCSDQVDGDRITSGFDTVTVRAPIEAGTWVTSYVHTLYLDDTQVAFSTEGRVAYTLEYA